MSATLIGQTDDLGGKKQASKTMRRQLRRANRARRFWAAALVAPLFVMVVVFFALPILGLLTGAVHSPEYVQTFPRSAEVVSQTDSFEEPFYEALYQDLLSAYETRSTGVAGRRLNQDLPGFSSMLRSATRAAVSGDAPPAGGYRDWFAAQDPNWVAPKYQNAIRRSVPVYTDIFLLKSMDLERGPDGSISFVPEGQDLFIDVFIRTIWISLQVTLICAVLGYPLAWALTRATTFWRGIMLLGVLFPFWTSLLVRTAAWMILLQREGPLNTMLLGSGIIDSPLTMVFNRFGTIVALTHILLPFLVLPLYSVMRSIPNDYMRAAKGLGARPARAFIGVFVPQTMPGLSAGAVLVFIMTVGYYITPALLGGPNDQMISYFIAFYVNDTINWGLAAALALNLIVVTMVLYFVYQKVTGTTRIGLGA